MKENPLSFFKELQFITKFVFTLILFAQFSCGPVQYDGSSVKIDTLIADKINIRALALADGRLWYGADKGRYGHIDLDSGVHSKAEASADSITGEFRSIAVSGEKVFLLNAGSPARLLLVRPDLSRKRVYAENHPDAFYDSMRFFTRDDGIAVGDPIGGCFSILTTDDGGINWKKLPCSGPIANREGEAAFAASNSNIASVGHTIWIFTGGNTSRVLKSDNAGKSWDFFPTPMVSGKSMTGTFAGDFYDQRNGMIVGGNYEDPESNSGNKAVTSNGGKTWALVADGSAFGYASSVRYVPGSRARKAMSVGPSGLYYTKDAGLSWRKLLSSPDFYTIIFENSGTAYAAGRGILVRLKFQ